MIIRLGKMTGDKLAATRFPECVFPPGYPRGTAGAGRRAAYLRLRPDFDNVESTSKPRHFVPKTF